MRGGDKQLPEDLIYVKSVCKDNPSVGFKAIKRNLTVIATNSLQFDEREVTSDHQETGSVAA